MTYKEEVNKLFRQMVYSFGEIDLQTDALKRNAVNGIRLNTRIYRYLPLSSLVRMLRTGESVLTSPYVRKDMDDREVINYKNGEISSVFSMLGCTPYIQQWTTSAHSENPLCDYNYGSREVFVRIKCKAEYVLRSMYQTTNPMKSMSCFIGRVKHGVPNLTSFIKRKGVKALLGLSDKKLAALLCAEPARSIDNQEVRLVYIDYANMLDLRNSYEVIPGVEVKYSVRDEATGINMLPIEEIMLAPWADSVQIQQVAEMLSNYGIDKKIVKRSNDALTSDPYRQDSIEEYPHVISIPYTKEKVKEMQENANTRQKIKMLRAMLKKHNPLLYDSQSTFVHSYPQFFKRNKSLLIEHNPDMDIIN